MSGAAARTSELKKNKKTIWRKMEDPGLLYRQQKQIEAKYITKKKIGIVNYKKHSTLV